MAEARQTDTSLEQQFEIVYRVHVDAVYRFCLSQVRNPALAEDLAADTFTSAYAAYPRVQPASNVVRPWLFRIARNQTIDHGRRFRRGLRAIGVLQARPAEARSVENAAQQRDDLRRVVAAITTLRPRDRVLVGLRVASALPFSEIAEIVGISEVAARAATHRALERVRAGMEDQR